MSHIPAHTYAEEEENAKFIHSMQQARRIRKRKWGAWLILAILTPPVQA
jgi:hypothetical protein